MMSKDLIERIDDAEENHSYNDGFGREWVPISLSDIQLIRKALTAPLPAEPEGALTRFGSCPHCLAITRKVVKTVARELAIATALSVVISLLIVGILWAVKS